jgi:uncharacterized protein
MIMVDGIMSGQEHLDRAKQIAGDAHVAETDRTSAEPGPVRPTASAAVTHRPLDGPGARLTGGLLHDWQRRSREASLPLALRQMEAAGNLDNLRLAIAGASEGYRGPVFMDSDLYKTLEAIGWDLANEPSQVLAGFAADATTLLEKAQQPDGYLNSYIQVSGEPRYSRLCSSHEHYCAGHLIQAAIAHARTQTQVPLLGVARRFADHLVDVFSGREAGIDGHPIIETALAELYRETGRADYLNLAGQFIDQRGRGLIGDSGFGRRYLQDHMPVREATSIVGHAVRALYLEAGVVDVAVETGDDELLASSVTRWEDMVTGKTSLTGGIGSRHDGESFGDGFELPPDRAYNETCAAIASLQWSWRLLLATGEHRYADLIERLIYNGVGPAISTDGQRFFYVNPLQRRSDHFEQDDPGRRREWFSCACCPPNIMRLMASLGHYLATTADDVLYVHQFTGASLAANLAGGTLRVEMTTSYPWSGAVDLEVRSAPADACGLAVRIPGWSAGATFRVNGSPVTPDPADRCYLVVRRHWMPGDVLRCDLNVAPRLTYPSRRIDALRGAVAVERGPLVYCFEQADQPGGATVEDLALGPADLRARDADVPAIGPTVLVEAAAARLQPVSRDGLPYDSAPGAGPSGMGTVGEAATAVAIPYFQWDNRDGRPMRVWMPRGSQAEPNARNNPAADRSQAADQTL